MASRVLQSSSSATDLCMAQPTASQELSTGPKRSSETGAKCGLRWTLQNRGKSQGYGQSQEPWGGLKAVGWLEGQEVGSTAGLVAQGGLVDWKRVVLQGGPTMA